MNRIISAAVVVVGAGPAGLAAAAAAADRGASVVVIDSGGQPGGQYWRHRSERTFPDSDGAGHHGWKTYRGLRRRFDAAVADGRLRYFPGQQVWMAQQAEDGFVLRTSPAVDSGAQGITVSALKLVLCTGGYDRQLPVPGWDLPGVMAAGGIQGFIKANGMLPGKRFVIAGTGPFLLSVAAGIAEAGGKVLGVYDSAALTNWVPHLHAAALVPEKALEGAEYAGVFARHRIPYRTRTVVTEVLGADCVEGVRTAKVDNRGRIRHGTERTIRGVDTVGFGWGFTPQLELPAALGVQTSVDTDGSLVGTVNDRQESSVPGLFLAGEITGVGGAALSVLEGDTAGTAAALSLAGTPVPPRRDRKNAYRRFAAAMHAAHPVPAAWPQWQRQDTLLCRCEEVTVGEAQHALDTLEASDSRTLKSLTRTGMGWCQGRVCGFAASCLTAGQNAGPSEVSLASTAKRPLASPVSIGNLAALTGPIDPPPSRTESPA